MHMVHMAFALHQNCLFVCHVFVVVEGQEACAFRDDVVNLLICTTSRYGATLKKQLGIHFIH